MSLSVDLTIALMLFALCSASIMETEYRLRRHESEARRNEKVELDKMWLSPSDFSTLSCKAQILSADLSLFSCLKGDASAIKHVFILE